MNDEYTYVPGQGWVFNHAPFFEFQTRNGRFRVVNRPPRDGEMFVSCSEWVQSNNLERFAAHCISCNWTRDLNSFSSDIWAVESCVTIEYLGPL